MGTQGTSKAVPVGTTDPGSIDRANQYVEKMIPVWMKYNESVN